MAMMLAFYDGGDARLHPWCSWIRPLTNEGNGAMSDEIDCEHGLAASAKKLAARPHIQLASPAAHFDHPLTL